MSRQRKFSLALPGSLPSQPSAARPPAWLAPWMPSLRRQAPPLAAVGYSQPPCRDPAPFSLLSPSCLTWAGNQPVNTTSAVIPPSICRSVCHQINNYNHHSISLGSNKIISIFSSQLLDYFNNVQKLHLNYSN